MTDYQIIRAGWERTNQNGRWLDDECTVIRLRVGKQAKLANIRLTDAESLLIATQLIESVQRRVRHTL